MDYKSGEMIQVYDVIARCKPVENIEPAKLQLEPVTVLTNINALTAEIIKNNHFTVEKDVLSALGLKENCSSLIHIEKLGNRNVKAYHIFSSAGLVSVDPLLLNFYEAEVFPLCVGNSAGK